MPCAPPPGRRRPSASAGRCFAWSGDFNEGRVATVKRTHLFPEPSHRSRGNPDGPPQPLPCPMTISPARLFAVPGIAFLLTLALATGCAPDTPPAATDPTDNVVEFVVMGTTDVHGQLVPWDYEREEPLDHGLARLAPLVDSIRAANPGRTLLIDSGDLLQGNPLTAVHTPLPEGETHPVILAMNHMGYDAAALGNHEFNFGLEHLNRSLEAADFPFLSANIVHADSGEPAWPTHTFVERELDGRVLRVGITAVVPPGVAIWDRDHVEGRLEFPDMVERLGEVVPLLREEGAHLVVVAAHASFSGTSYDTVTTGLGAESRMADAAWEVEGMDAAFLGHSHRQVADSIINGVLFSQAGSHGRALAVATFHLSPEGDDGWQIVERRSELVHPTEDHLDETLMDLLAPAHERAVGEMGRVVGRAAEEWSAREARVGATPLIDWVNRVQQEVTGADLSAAAAFSLTAGFPEGDITVARMARFYPYDNNLLRAVRITGAELRAYLEHSARYFLPCPEAQCDRLVNPEWPGFNFDMVRGVEYTLDLTRPWGERVVELERNGRPVADDDVFTMALNNYRQSGGGAFPAVADAEVVYEGDESVRDILIRALEAEGEIRIPADFEANWRIVPEALAEQALREMHGERR
ncbi:MAG: bifunctional metallophosphatase/5'-nucleotidase [Gemmatimonadales bacterium]|nr:MAG: bifunctional metallophosphatase/5'-nucleotidase [Gemmatimonadales bacterium]